MPGPGADLIGKEEIQQVLEVLESGYLFRYGNAGDPRFKHKVYTFEQEFGKYLGVKHALCLSSGTGALWAALMASGIEPGDEVIVPAYTFVATYTSTIFAGAVPVLAEIDESLTIDPAAIEKRITPKTKAIIPVHMLGNPCNMDAIMGIAKKHGLTVIEDACQAGGASYRGRRVGSIGQMGAFSLNIFKTITAGDGGVVVSDDLELYERAFGYHDQGHCPHRSGVEVGKRSILGLNLRVNEIVGALALAQLGKLERILATLRSNKAKFRELIGEIAGVHFRTINDPEGECATLLTVLFDDAARAGRVCQALNTTTVDHSGWHVYANMEHVGKWLAQAGQPHGRGAYPRTDDILSRAVNLGVGVVDAGLGSAFGINIHANEEDIRAAAEKFRRACQA